jgi:thioredoxin-like negative regulator of GroEL
MKPVFEEVANSMKDKCKFVTICKEKAEDIFAEQKLQGVPTIIIFKGGKEQDRIVGATSKEDLSKKIEESLEEHE